MSNRTPGIAAMLLGGLIAGVIGLPAVAQSAAAEDIVYLKASASGSAPRRLRGEITEYTGRELRLKSPTGRERTIASHLIERIDTTYSAEQTAGDKAFARGDFRAAYEQYRLALTADREPRDWMRRRILAPVVWCLRSLGKLDLAGTYFLILVSRDPTTPDFDCIPLAWTDEPPAPAVVEKARVWLNDPKNPAAILMGASALLSTDQRGAAVERLQALSRDADPRIAWLAQAQLWRAVAAADVTPEQLRGWSEAIESSDSTLRGGAYFLVGSAWAARDPDEGALWLMKLPILYPREHRLAAGALLTSGACLERVDRKPQAARLYRELTRKYGQTAEAAEARRRLQSLASIEPARDN
jgi:tetratricopeptide (TPR) repeat protein